MRGNLSYLEQASKLANSSNVMTLGGHIEDHRN